MRTVELTFEQFVAARFAGRLSHGAHEPDGHACVNEALRAYEGKSWGDDGYALDLRALNDAPWLSDEARTEAMLPVGNVILAFEGWTHARRQEWAKAVAEGVIRRILPPALRRVAELVPDKATDLAAAALRCENGGTAEAAADAARAAARAARAASAATEDAAWGAAWGARAAAASARSAEAAAEAAREARSAAAAASAAAARSGRDAPLKELCRIMVEAAS